jgi:hypothetical protein
MMRWRLGNVPTSSNPAKLASSYVVIDIIIAPVDRPQVDALALADIQHPLAPKIMDAMRQRGPTPVGLWKLINGLAKAENPDSRARRRCWQLRFWGAVRELWKVELLYRHRGLIATRDFAFKPRPKAAKRLSPSVSKTLCQTAGSNAPVTVTANGMEEVQLVQTEIVNGSGRVMAARHQSENARPTAEQISVAASLLAMRPRPRKRKWTGVLHGERLRRHAPVEVPSGDVLAAFAVQRGKVFVFAPEGSGRLLDRYDGSEVRRIKNPAAQMMGQLKRNKRERRSEAKIRAARANARMPPRPGSRPRGRPRKSSLAYMDLMPGRRSRSSA